MLSTSLNAPQLVARAAPSNRGKVSRRGACNPKCSADGAGDHSVQARIVLAAPQLSVTRREAFAVGAASLVALALPAGPAQAIGFEKKLKKKVSEDEYVTGEPFDWRGEKHEGLKYFDLEVGKGKPVENGALLSVHFDVRYRSIVVVSSRESRLLGGNRTIAEPLEFKYGVIPEQFLKPRKRKTVIGVGIELRLGSPDSADNGLLVVQDVTKNGPAYNAGVRPLDRITEIDGKTTRGLTAAEVGKALSGAEGEPISFTVLKGSAAGEAVKVECKREAVAVKPKEGQSAFDGPAGGLFTGAAGPKPPPALWLAVAGMREGGKRTVIVPGDVGYEDIGYNEIPPDATITLDIEILSVRKPTEA